MPENLNERASMNISSSNNSAPTFDAKDTSNIEETLKYVEDR